MPTDPDRRFTCRASRRAAAAVLLALALTACASAPPVLPAPARPAPAQTTAHPAEATRTATPPVPAARPQSTSATPAAPAPPTVATTTVPAEPIEPDPNAALLRYADRVRALSASELGAEVAALGDPGVSPARQLQLAIALMHTQQPIDTVRALVLAQRVAAAPGTDAAPYRPLARLLSQRLAEQRRLEESTERQAQQLREQQRRIDQLNERLEAMRAIERSLNTRPGATTRRAPPVPAP